MLPALKWSRYRTGWPCHTLFDLWDHVAVAIRGVVACHDSFEDVVGPFTWFEWAAPHFVTMRTDPTPDESRLHLREPGERDPWVERSKRWSGHTHSASVTGHHCRNSCELACLVDCDGGSPVGGGLPRWWQVSAARGIVLYAWLALVCEATSGRHDGGLCDKDDRCRYTGRDSRKNSAAVMENPATYLPHGSQDLDASGARFY